MRLGVKSGIAKMISTNTSKFKAQIKKEQVARDLMELANSAPFNRGGENSGVRGGVKGQDSDDGHFDE